MRHLRILFLMIAGLYYTANGQVNYLDSTFNETGILTLSHTGSQDFPAVTLTRPNGKSLVVGYAYFDNRTPASTLTTVAVVQYDINGNPDPAFGQNGFVVLDDMPFEVDAKHAVLQPDGKLLITGEILRAASGRLHYIVRLNEDGSMDTSFGNNGITAHPDEDLIIRGSSLAVQPDGKILMGGNKFTYVAPWGYYSFALIRFNTNGSVDDSFGSNGVVLGDYTPDSDVLSIAVGADSLIYTGGTYDSYGSMIARFLPNGMPDLSFGTGGYVQLSDNGGIGQLYIQSNGLILVGGAPLFNFKAFIRRLHADGTIDETFEDAGVLDYDKMCGFAVKPDGYVVAGVQNYERLRVLGYTPDGQIDTGFGKEISNPYGYVLDKGLMLQPDGKIIIGGTYEDEFKYQDFSLIRLEESLEIDANYGTNGFVVQNCGTGISEAASLFIDDQNRVVVGGEALYTDGTTIVNLERPFSTGFVSRFQPDGIQDTTFSSNGYWASVEGASILKWTIPQPDGRIIVAGGTDELWESPYFTVARLMPDGSRDTTFGYYSGSVGFYFENAYEAYAGAVALTPDHAILVMGKIVDNENNHKIAVVRFLGDGWVDDLFGSYGVVLSDAIPGGFKVTAGLVQPDGKILLAGTNNNPWPNIFLMRFMPNGSPDNSFGTGGLVLKPYAGEAYYLNDMQLQADGQILLCGSQGGNIFVGRLNPDGTKDLTFSNDGLVVVNTGTVEAGNSLAVQADGKIVVAGYSGSTTAAANANPLILRLLQDGTPDSTFAGFGYVATNLPGNNQLKALAIQSDGSYVAAGYSNNDYLLIRYLSHLSVGLLVEPVPLFEVLVYPNPIQGTATFNYSLPEPTVVSLELFDMQGKRCHSFLQNDYRPQGDNNETLLFPQALMPGNYVLRLQTEKGSRSVRVMVVQ